MQVQSRVRSRYIVFTSEYLLPMVIILFISLLSYLSLVSPLLRIRTVVCILDYSPCSEGVLTAEMSRYIGSNLLLFDELPIKERLMSAQPTLGQVEVKKVLPSTLHVELTSVSPAFAIKQDGDDRYVVLDEKLRVIGLRPSDPHVSTLEVTSLPPFQIGARLDGALSAALSAMRLVKEASIPTSSFSFQGNVLTIKLQAGPVALLTVSDPPEPQISSLQAVLRDPKIFEGVATVDVRYTQPILK